MRVEADEQWSFVGARRPGTPPRRATATCGIDAGSKLVMSWLVGARTPKNAGEFVAELASRCADRVQLSTNGHGMYLSAVRKAFDFVQVDSARVVKVLGQGPEGATDASRRYSPPVVIDTIEERMIGRPDIDLISTSYVERLNLNTPELPSLYPANQCLL